jgi:PAS domain S-box-containing protein
MSGSGSMSPSDGTAGDGPRNVTGRRVNLILTFITLFILIVILISLLTGSRSQQVYLPMLQAVEETRIDVTMAHLILEEIIGGDASKGVDEVWLWLDAAQEHLESVTEGRAEGRAFLEERSELRRLTEVVHEQLATCREFTHRRLAIDEGRAVDSELDMSCNRSHEQVLAGCDELRAEIERLLQRSQRRFVALQISLMLIGVSLALLLGLLFYRYRLREQEALHSLAAGEERMQALSDASFEAIFLSEKGICLDQNLTAERLFGYTLEEALDRPGTDWIVPEDRDLVMRNMLDGVTDAYRVTALRKDGSTFPAMIQGRMEERPGQAPIRVTALRDISSRQQAEDDLRHLFEMVPVAIWREDFSAGKRYLDEKLELSGCDWRQHLEEHPELVREFVELIHILDVNQAAVAMHEARDKEHLIASVGTTFTEESLVGFREEILAFHAGEVTVEIEGRVQTVNGRSQNVLVRAFLDPEAEDWSKVYVAITDLTEIKRATRERRLAEKDRDRLAAVIEQAPQIVVIADTDGDIAYVNPGFESGTGYSSVEVLGRNPRILISDRHDSGFFKRIGMTLLRGETWRGRIVSRRRDGTLFTAESVISPIMNSEGETVNYVAVMQNVTREIMLEAQLQQSQKLEAVGQLAGGVAHDFNNILQAIQGYADFAKTGLDPDSRRWQDINEIHSSANRASKLTHQLLAFSRQQATTLAKQDLNALILKLLEMLRRLIGETIRIDFHPDPELALVMADGGQVEQVLMNLCLNARDAMPEGGVITIRTENTRFVPGAPALPPLDEEGSWAMIQVGDDGQGMSRGVKERAFEPYFTTKPVGKGSGLGLSTVFGIVEQHGGVIDLVTEPEQGTRIRIFIPQLDDSREVTEVATETLLLIAEQADGPMTLQGRLEQAGYRVLTAVDAERARELLTKQAEGFDLVLLDPSGSGVNIQELESELSALAPGLKIIYTHDLDPEASPEGPRFREPLEPDDLQQAIRRALDE